MTVTCGIALTPMSRTIRSTSDSTAAAVRAMVAESIGVKRKVNRLDWCVEKSMVAGGDGAVGEDRFDPPQAAQARHESQTTTAGR